MVALLGDAGAGRQIGGAAAGSTSREHFGWDRIGEEAHRVPGRLPRARRVAGDRRAVKPGGGRLKIRTDCRHYRTSVPCAPHKRTGVSCGAVATTGIEERIVIVKLDAMGDVRRTRGASNR